MNPGKAVEQQIGKLMRPERMELCRVLGGIEALHKLVSMGKDIPREKLKDWCERHMSNITQTLEGEGVFDFLEEEE